MCDRLLVGVAGSVRAVQLPEYLQVLRAEFTEQIKIIATRSASRMIPPRILELYADDRVFVDLWDRSPTVKVPHVNLVEWAEMFLILPATASIIGKAANGIGDDLLSTAVIMARAPVLFAPAMNADMWNSAAVQRNVAQLVRDGNYVVQPSLGLSVTSSQNKVHGVGPGIENLLRQLQHFFLHRLQVAQLSSSSLVAHRALENELSAVSDKG
ncbi:phosphopantothenoylcysteine decarboxylase [Limnochorda pilosa]|uniref:Phosphopantothenoylcysteine decarboxylase n=2 Tax=Limnochorda pilosa TaxID=1555112 RepID=A0A0K2SKL6_LIMPI|nr:phosphopantothenoylcysteine decarboxylase [Limnochorda pilosa]